MKLSDYTVSPSFLDYSEHANVVIDFIKEDTTPEAFDEECKKYDDYKLDSPANYRKNETALGKAAFVGNLILVNHIIQKGDSLLLRYSNDSEKTPLHSAIECKNKEKGYEIVKILLQSGTPVNIVGYDVLRTQDYTHTPLELALWEEHIPTIAYLLRKGGVARPELIASNEKYAAILEKAKAHIKEQNTKALLFMWNFKEILPDTCKYIAALYYKVVIS